MQFQHQSLLFYSLKERKKTLINKSLINLIFRYTPACSKLIAQFKNAQKYLQEEVPNIANFMTEYKVLIFFFCFIFQLIK